MLHDADAVCVCSEGKKIDRAHMAVVNAFGDMFDIVPHVMEDQRPNFHDMTHDEVN